MAEYLIIGADAAGLSAAGQIDQKHPGASIKVINKGKIISYGACGIPYVISGDIPSEDDLIHFTPESFRAMRGIPVEVDQEAVGLFSQEKCVEIKDLKTNKIYREEYKKLMLGTGAEPIRLPFLDYSAAGIFNVHNIDDLTQIQSYINTTRPKNAAIIGAGNIGLELCEALHRQKLEVLLFEIFPEPAFIWPPLIRKAVLAKLAEKGITFLGETAVKSVQKSGPGFIVKTDQQAYAADMIFSVVGTKPAIGFCGEDLRKSPQGALAVDRYGQTSDPDIYAAGDCATVFHKLLDRSIYFPLGSTANKMGRIAGLNMAGEKISFPGIVGSQIFKFFELSLAKTGLSQSEAEKEGFKARTFTAKRMDRAGYYPGVSSVKVNVVGEESTGRMLGAAAVCTTNAALYTDPAAVAVFNGMTIHDLGWFDSAYAPPYAPVWNALISAALKGDKR